MWSLLQGHNWIIVYSRPVYFCLCCMLIWVFDLVGNLDSMLPFTLYGVTFFSAHFLLCARDMLIGLFTIIQSSSVKPLFELCII